jgi:hypothetical protein
MVTHITQLIYTESGGFAGLQRGCTIEPQFLPPEPLGQLQGLLQQAQTEVHTSNPVLRMPDMQVYTLELVSQAEPPQADGAHEPAQLSTRHRVLQYPASDVPESLALLMEFLHDQAVPLPLR